MSELVIQEYTNEELRKLTDEAREDLFNFLRKIEILWKQEADVKLGYGDRDHGSWQKYMRGEFTSLPQIKRAERKPLTIRLNELGMSTRDIAESVGASDWTIRQDLEGARNLATRSTTEDDITIDSNVIDAEVIDEPEIGHQHNPDTVPKANPTVIWKEGVEALTQQVTAMEFVTRTFPDSSVRQRKATLKELEVLTNRINAIKTSIEETL
jgi:predicted transcriptional regulator